MADGPRNAPQAHLPLPLSPPSSSSTAPEDSLPPHHRSSINHFAASNAHARSHNRSGGSNPHRTLPGISSTRFSPLPPRTSNGHEGVLGQSTTSAAPQYMWDTSASRMIDVNRDARLLGISRRSDPDAAYDYLFESRRRGLVAPLRPVSTPTDNTSSGYVSLEESDQASEAAAMAPATRHRPEPRRSSVIDLTNAVDSTEPTSQASRGIKRRRESAATTASEDRAPKRRGRLPNEEIEEIDLSHEPPSVEEELLQRQQQEAIRSQQAASDDSRPQRIGQRQCVICMENYTNATTAACGMCILLRSSAQRGFEVATDRYNRSLLLPRVPSASRYGW